MLLKTRIARQAKDIAQAQLVTQIQHFGCAIMTVSAQQNISPGPMLADFPDQSAQMGGTLASFGAPSRAQYGPDQPAISVKDHDGLEAVFIIVRVEQAQLLVPVDRIEGVVDIQNDLSWCPYKGLAVKTDHSPGHPDQVTRLGQVLHPRDRGL